MVLSVYHGFEDICLRTVGNFYPRICYVHFLQHVAILHVARHGTTLRLIIKLDAESCDIAVWSQLIPSNARRRQ